MLTESLHYCTLLLKEFLLFFTVPISVKPVMPIRTAIAIRLMVSFAVHTFEDIRTWLTSNGDHTICFLIFHATPCFLSVVFGIVSSITLGISEDMRASAKCRMTPLPIVFTLRNSWVHICFANGCNKSFNIESTIDDVLHTRTTLGVPDVHPYYCFIQLG